MIKDNDIYNDTIKTKNKCSLDSIFAKCFNQNITFDFSNDIQLKRIEENYKELSEYNGINILKFDFLLSKFVDAVEDYLYDGNHSELVEIIEYDESGVPIEWDDKNFINYVSNNMDISNLELNTEKFLIILYRQGVINIIKEFLYKWIDYIENNKYKIGADIIYLVLRYDIFCYDKELQDYYIEELKKIYEDDTLTITDECGFLNISSIPYIISSFGLKDEIMDYCISKVKPLTQIEIIANKVSDLENKLYNNDYLSYCHNASTKCRLFNRILELLHMLKYLNQNGCNVFFNISKKLRRIEDDIYSILKNAIDADVNELKKDASKMNYKEKYEKLKKYSVDIINSFKWNGIKNIRIKNYYNYTIKKLFEENDFEIEPELLTDDNYDDYLIQNIDNFDGIQFENYCVDLLKKRGFTNVSLTKATGDQGVDIIAFKDDIKYAIQCKCYSQDLGNTPIQEVAAGIKYYDCHIGIVITNRYFTKDARTLAKANNVLLWDRDKIIEIATMNS